ncbi:MAG: DegT/DnrJ/EryC1/StrS family aminotransferase [Opitutae bacterium]|nr:DegT/DnrJ/EryC1/StrS family aminotransferase [Opitutae bacterium]
MSSKKKSSSKKALRPIPAPSLGAALIGKEEEKLALQVLRSRALFRYYGPDPKRPPMMVATLEKEFRKLSGAKYALAVTSGTAALEAALGALGVGPGDEVIVPAWSWISCFTAIVRVGGKPVLAEINDTLSLDPKEIARLTTPRTKAVLVVHFQGVAADMDPIIAEAKKAGIAVLEDCAQSPGVIYKGKRIGTIGDIGIYSFQHNKTITSGEGGMLVTNNPRLYERAVRMSDLGQMRPYHAQQVPPSEPGFAGSQFRMPEIIGALALAQVRKLDKIRKHCRKLNARIMKKIGKLPGIKFRTIPDPKGDSGFEIYFWPATKELRDAFRNKLIEAKIPCTQMTGTYAQYRREYVVTGLAHAPSATPFPVGPGWPAKGYRQEDFPVTEDLAPRFVVLPIGMNFTEADADRIAAAVVQIHRELGIS